MSKAARGWLVAVLVLGTVVRFHQVLHPFDYRSLNSWREADYVQVARGFFNDRGDIFHPTVDWGGAGEGYVEMEFPYVPFTASLLYRIFAYDERFLRLISALCSVASLFVFTLLARRVLTPLAAVAATTLFSVHGLLIGLSGGIQPEPLQLLLSILAVWALMSWYQGGRQSRLLVGALLCGFGILAKSPSALLGFVFAYFVLLKEGKNAFRLPVVYLAVVLALIPPIAWYGWAHTLYTRTGLSLGLSNETHFINAAIFKNPLPQLRGLVRHEVWEVFAGFGIVLGMAALFSKGRDKVLPLVWLASGALFYIITIDTSGDSWAYYYHCNTVPPACLLMGTGLTTLTSMSKESTRGVRWERAYRVIGLMAFTATVLATVYHGSQLFRTINDNPRLQAMYECYGKFAGFIGPQDLILVRGGTRYDPHGHPVAFNESMAFAWMNRQGFNYPIEDYSLDMLRHHALRGVKYWVAVPDDVRDSTVYIPAKQYYAAVDSCGPYVLLDLQGPGERGVKKSMPATTAPPPSPR